MTIVLDGSELTVEKLVRIARHGEKVELHPAALERIKTCRNMLEEKLKAREMKEETNLEVVVRQLLLEDCFETDHGSHHHKTYLCDPISGHASPGYEPEVEASERYAIVEVGWFDLRDEASWGAKLVNDHVTYTLMCKLRAALGYASELPDTTPSTGSIPAITL